MASDFSQSFQQALLMLAGAIAQQQSVSVGSNISGTNSGQSVVVASTAVLGSLIGINAVNTMLVSSPATTSTTRTSTSNSNDVGRPKLDVTKEEILCLKQLNYSWKAISEILQVPRQTLYRRLHEFGIDKFTAISESNLDFTLRRIKADHPACGEVMIQGHLLHSGIKVQRSKLRAAIHRVDHDNTVSRHSSVIRRRIYSSSHPNAVWHLDGNHKMIRWKMVIHAGIDGFSQLITYIKCANNNLAITVLQEFLRGVSVFGLPDSVRTDHGGENVDVWRQMLSTHQDSSCILTGNSVHNERIERLWRDVTRCVSHLFISTFYELEAEGVLNPDNEIDTFCLQVVFLPRINKSLTDFQGSWNNHPLSTEGNMSPLQLCTSGFIASSNHAVTQTGTNSSPPLSVDINTDNLECVEVPCNKFVPCDVLIAIVQSAVGPLAQSTNDGRTLYHSYSFDWPAFTEQL